MYIKKDNKTLLATESKTIPTSNLSYTNFSEGAELKIIKETEEQYQVEIYRTRFYVKKSDVKE